MDVKSRDDMPALDYQALRVDSKKAKLGDKGKNCM
jgi:hypothetical protein